MKYYELFSNFLAKNLKILPLDEAIKIVRPLGFDKVYKYLNWHKTTKPNNLTSKPIDHYIKKGEWNENKRDEFWTYYFGNPIISNQAKNKKFNKMSYEEGQKILKDKGITTLLQYYQAKKDGALTELPSHMYRQWKDVWKLRGGLSGFVEGKPKTSKEIMADYETARNYIQNVIFDGKHIKSETAYRKWAATNDRPSYIPANPARDYKGIGWREENAWGHFLGTGRIANQNKKSWSFEKARTYLHSRSDITGPKDLRRLRNEGKCPLEIPTNYRTVYEKDFLTDGDFYGTGNIAPNQKFIDMPKFPTAKKLYHKLAIEYEITTPTEWRNRVNELKLPKNLPPAPDRIYTKERVEKQFKIKNPKIGLDYFQDFNDTFGVDYTEWSTGRVKELVKDVIDSKILEIPSRSIISLRLFIDGELASVGAQNRYYKLLRSLSFVSGNQKEIDKIYAFVNSNTSTPPKLNVKSAFLKDEYSKPLKTTDQEEEETDDETVSKLIESYKSPNISDVFSMTNLLKGKIVSSHSDLAKFIQNFLLHELWNIVFAQQTKKDEAKEIKKIKNKLKSKNKIDKRISGEFLKEYDKVRKLKIPKNYCYKDDHGNILQPFLMQLYTAYQITIRKNLGNISEPGTGKTLSGLLGSCINNSKKVLILCPKNVVEQWAQRTDSKFMPKSGERDYDSYFSDLTALVGKKIFEEKKYKNPVYHIINYDKFNSKNTHELIKKLKKNNYDFIILDEIQKAKNRTISGKKSSRRTNIEDLIFTLKKNPNTKTLSMTATPIINNIHEGVSFLNLLEGSNFLDLQLGNPTIVNAVMLHEKLRNVSIRAKQDLNSLKNEKFWHVTQSISEPKASRITSVLKLEEKLTDARIKKIMKIIKDAKGKTIIYTENVGQSLDDKTILEKISNALSSKKITHGFYTGERKDGRKKFLEGKIDVLIGSLPLSVGNDGFQHICNNLIFNVLPWTYADYEQIVGRLVRKGQNKSKVNIHIISAKLKIKNDETYHWDKHVKLETLRYKRTLSECAVDGIAPFKGNTKGLQKKATKALTQIATSLTHSRTFGIRPKIEPAEILIKDQKDFKFSQSDFTKMNLKFSNNNSQQNMKWFTDKPEDWNTYHKLQEESFRKRGYQPTDIWIERLKKLSKNKLIGDFGCGKGQILQAFPGRVWSFDHKSIDPAIKQCNMSDVSEYVDDGDLDVVLFSLSLMAKDWKDSLKEAWRCLPDRGELFISITSNQFEGKFSQIEEYLEELGFVKDKRYEEDILVCLEYHKVIS